MLVVVKVNLGIYVVPWQVWLHLHCYFRACPTHSPICHWRQKARFGNKILSVVKMLATRCKNCFASGVCIRVLLLLQGCSASHIHFIRWYPQKRDCWAAVGWVQGSQQMMKVDPWPMPTCCKEPAHRFLGREIREHAAEEESGRIGAGCQRSGPAMYNAFLTNGRGALAACESDSDHPPAKKSREKLCVWQDWFTRYKWLWYRPLSVPVWVTILIITVWQWFQELQWVLNDDCHWPDQVQLVPNLKDVWTGCDLVTDWLWLPMTMFCSSHRQTVCWIFMLHQISKITLKS